MIDLAQKLLQLRPAADAGELISNIISLFSDDMAKQDLSVSQYPTSQHRTKESRRIARKRKLFHQYSEGCRCKACANVITAQATPRFEVGVSTIAEAGQGLFAAEDIKAGTFLGEYKGEVRFCTRNGEESEDDEDDDDKVTCFAISTSKL